MLDNNLIYIIYSLCYYCKGNKQKSREGIAHLELKYLWSHLAFDMGKYLKDNFPYIAYYKSDNLEANIQYNASNLRILSSQFDMVYIRVKIYNVLPGIIIDMFHYKQHKEQHK